MNVVVRLRGRVGNQLFQYWTGYAVAKRLGADLWFEPSTGPSPELLKLVPWAAAPAEVLVETLGESGWRGRVQRFRQRWQVSSRRRFWQDKYGAFDPKLAEVGTSCFLDGYWQSYRYFQHLPPATFDGLRARLDDLASHDPWLKVAQSSVVLHVRRTDFVPMGLSLSPDYYRQAMEQFPGGRFLIVTDDPAYCREAFSNDPAVEIVSDEARTAWQDLNLLVHAQGVVTANSTFSWWGAYLNRTEGRPVVVPNCWLAPEPGFAYNLDDVYPAEWTRI